MGPPWAPTAPPHGLPAGTTRCHTLPSKGLARALKGPICSDGRDQILHDGPMESGHGLDAREAEAIVTEAAGRYFAACRARIEPFIDANFSLAGSARLHGRALGWDLLRAPANVALAVPPVLLKLGAGAARRLDRPGVARALDRDIFLDTAVAREIRWRMMTELLELPFADGARSASRDGLAEAIVAHPRVHALVLEAGKAAAARSDDAEFRRKLAEALTSYAGTRAAAAEITTALIAIGTGALAFQKATPGAIALGPVIAGSIAQGSAIASFPLGATAGGLWHAVFPAQASPFLVAGATAGVIGVAAVATAFAGIIADPVQRATGLHRRRLTALVDSLEQGFHGSDAAGFVAYDLYVARLIDLGDLLLGIARNFRPA